MASSSSFWPELVKAVSDGYTARVYYTLTDETGDRLNGHTQEMCIRDRVHTAPSTVWASPAKGPWRA